MWTIRLGSGARKIPARYSALYFTNMGANPAAFTVNFAHDDGTPLNVPSVGGSSTIVNLAPGGTAIVEAPNVGAPSEGSAFLALPGGVVGYGVFRQSLSGEPDQEAVVPLSGASTTTSELIWDDTSFTTAVAIVNPSSVTSLVSIAVRDRQGNTIGTSSVTRGPRAKTALVLRLLSGLGAMVGNRGVGCLHGDGRKRSCIGPAF